MNNQVAVQSGLANFNPTTFEQAEALSIKLAKTKIVPEIYQGKPDDILGCILLGNDVGLSPMHAVQSIAVINNKPSIYGDGLLAIAQNQPSFIDIIESIEGSIKDNTAVATCILKRKGKADIIKQFSVEDAILAGLWNKAGPWRQYPARMLQMRARGFAIRDGFAAALKGMAVAEEQDDIKDVTPSQPVSAQDEITNSMHSQPTSTSTISDVDTKTGEVLTELTLAEVIEKIRSSSDLPSLLETSPLAKRLPEVDRPVAKAEYDIRKKELLSNTNKAPTNSQPVAAKTAASMPKAGDLETPPWN